MPECTAYLVGAVWWMPHGWGWGSPSPESWVAIATLALAAATVGVLVATLQLGRRTRDLGRDGEAQLALLREQIASSHRAYLSVVPYEAEGLKHATIRYESGLETTVSRAADVDVRKEGDWVHFSIPIRNIGVGPALLESVDVRYEDDQNRQHTMAGRTTLGTIPPGERARLLFSFPPTQAAIFEGLWGDRRRAFVGVVRYTDYSRNYSVAEFSVDSDDGAAWRVRSLTAYPLGREEDLQFTTSGPR